MIDLSLRHQPLTGGLRLDKFFCSFSAQSPLAKWAAGPGLTFRPPAAAATECGADAGDQAGLHGGLESVRRRVRRQRRRRRALAQDGAQGEEVAVPVWLPVAWPQPCPAVLRRRQPEPDR